MPRDREILFCPFCREGFEGLVECPEHELTLVRFDRLPRSSRPPRDEVAFFGDPRLGRGGVLLGAALVLIGFLGPLAVAGEATASALEVALEGAHNLWLVPVAAIAILWILFRRRDRTRMRAARLAVLGLSLGGLLPLLYTGRRVSLMAGAQASDLSWRWGFLLMLLGLLLAAGSSLQLGGARMPRED